MKKDNLRIILEGVIAQLKREKKTTADISNKQIEGWAKKHELPQMDVVHLIDEVWQQVQV